MVTVLHARAFRDNYIWIVRGDTHDQVAIVDPGDAVPVLDLLRREQLTPCAILCTHHHGDHVGGVEEIARAYPVPIYGPAKGTIPGLTHLLREGDTVTLPALGITFRVWEVPGHTLDHIAFVNDDILFCGDTLFSAGCGRLFEGTAAQLHRSLTRFAALPSSTKVYCAHEYTLANLRFALAVEPGNADAVAYRAQAESRLAAGNPTLPSTVDLERRVNPFLRVAQPAVRRAIEAQVGRRLHDDISAFTALRRWKDDFRG